MENKENVQKLFSHQLDGLEKLNDEQKLLKSL